MSIDKKALKEYILKEGKEAKEANRTRYSNLDEWSKRFEALRSTACLDDDIKRKPWFGASNVGIPIDAMVVYTIQARLLKAQFGIDPPISMRPSDLPYVHDFQRMINWEMWEEMALFMDMLLVTQAVGIDGDRIVKTVFDRDEIYYDDDVLLYLDENGEAFEDPDTGAPLEATHEDAQPIGDPLKGMIYTPQKAQMQRNRLIYLGPKVIQIPAKRFLVPRDADHPDCTKLRWNIHEFWKPYGWVHSMAEQRPDMFDKEEVDNLRKDKDKERAIEDDSKLKTLGIDAATKTKNYKFWEWHGRWEDDKGREHELVALVCPDEKRFLGCIPNRFFFKTKRRQFVHYTMFPMVDRFYSKGVVEWLRGIRSMLDAIINTDLDRESSVNAPTLLYNLKKSGFDPSEHKFGTGKTWGLTDVNELKYLTNPNITSMSQTMAREQMLFDIVQRLFGLTDYVGGGGQKKGGAKGASAINQLINETNIRFDVAIKIFQEWSNPDLANQIFKHNMLNLPEILEAKEVNKPKEIFGPLANLPPDVVNRDFEFQFRGNTATVNPAQEIERITMLFKTMAEMKNPFVVNDPDLMQDMTSKYFEAFGWRGKKVKTVEEFRKMSTVAPREAQADRAKALQEHLQLQNQPEQPQEVQQ